MSKFDPQKYHRHSIRLKGYDYAQPGAYFVTIVTWQRECLFGKIVDGVMQVNDWGNLAQNEWHRLVYRFNNVQFDEFVVMPNHVHGIVVILDRGMDESVGARQEKPSPISESPLASPLPNGHPFGVLSGSLGAIVGAFKSTTTRWVNGIRRTPGAPLWQRNYYEHVIRNESEWARIRQYIQSNPTQWEIDQENPGIMVYGK